MKKKKFEFSKIIMVSVMLTYYIALIFGMSIIWRLSTNLSPYIGTAITAFFSFVGAPVAVAIGFYSWKAKNENISKNNSHIINETDFVNNQSINNNLPINPQDGI